MTIRIRKAHEGIHIFRIPGKPEIKREVQRGVHIRVVIHIGGQPRGFARDAGVFALCPYAVRDPFCLDVPNIKRDLAEILFLHKGRVCRKRGCRYQQRSQRQKP